jgi:hypothetical protein
MLAGRTTSTAITAALVAVLAAALALGVTALAAGPAAATPDQVLASPGSGSVTGIITGEGRPLPFATVRLVPVASSSRPEPAPVLVTRTDGRGWYTFSGLPRMAAQVRADAPSGSGLVDTAWPRAFTVADAGRVQVGTDPVRADIDLPRGGSVAGRVVDAGSGAVVPGAVVAATARSGPRVEHVGAPGQEPGGGFRITGLPPLPLRLSVRLPATSPYLGPWFWPAGSPQRGQLAVDGRATTADVVIRLDRGAEVRGTVRDDAGSPVAGALVGVGGCAIGCPVAVPSDARGRYRIIGIPPGGGLTVSTWLGTGDSYRFWYDRARSEQEAERLTLAAGEVRDDLELTLPRGAELRLRVVDLDGQPLAGVVAQLRPAGEGPGAGGYGARRNFAARDPQDPTRRLLGPVLAGRYELVILRSAADRRCRPDAWATSDGVARDGGITLAPGDRVEATVRLDCALPTIDAGTAPPCRTRARAPGPTGPAPQQSAWPWPSPEEAFRELPAWAQPAAR